MAKVGSIKLNELQIEGYEGDYVFETIRENCDFYEKVILEKWTPYIRGSKVILDIGANLGNHTLYWTTEMPECRVYSFEPYLPTFALLKDNVSINHLDNVTIYNKGVGRKKAFAHVTHTDEKNMGATTLEYNADGSDGIEIVDIDSLVQENEIKGAIDFVKIDTEGFEVDVLKGMVSVLRSMHPDIWIEVGSDTCVEILDRLEQLDYCAADIEGANILFLFKERHAQIESIDKSKVIQKMLYYYQRTNDYYGLYNTVKADYNIVREKNSVLSDNYERVKEWYSSEQQKNAMLTENYDRMKEWHSDEQQKNAALTENYTRVKEWHENDLKKIQEKQSKIQEQQNKIQEQQDKIQEQENNIREQQRRIQEQMEAYERIKQWRENDQQKLIDVIKAEYQQMLIMEKAKRNIQKQQTEIQILRAENESYKQKLSVIYDTWYGKITMKCYKFLKRIKRKFFK